MAEAAQQAMDSPSVVRRASSRRAVGLQHLKQGTLFVLIKSADNLVACDKNGLSDPYCVVGLRSDIPSDPSDTKPKKKNQRITMGSRGKTSTKKKTLSPVWNQSFELEAVEAKFLQLTIYDWDRISSDDICAETEVDLSSLHLKNQTPVEHEVQLQPQGTLKCTIEYVDDQSLFGLDLESASAREHKPIPHIITECIRVIEEKGMDTEGIYRLSGASSAIQALKQGFSNELDYTIPEDMDENAVAGVLKLYLRELPDPLFTFSLHHQFIQAAAEEKEAIEIAALVAQLPDAHFLTVKTLFSHLRKVSDKYEVNKMSVHNLGTVFGPSVLREPPSKEMTMMGHQSLSDALIQSNKVVEAMINYVDVIQASIASETKVATHRGHKPSASNLSTRAVQLFIDYDADHSESLEYSEFRALCYDLGFIVQEEEFQKLSQTGSVSLEEFEDWLRRSGTQRAQLMRSESEQAAMCQVVDYFKYFDTHLDGRINRDMFWELWSDLVQHDPNLKAEDFDVCLKEVDTDNDGFVSLEEFIDWLDRHSQTAV